MSEWVLLITEGDDSSLTPQLSSLYGVTKPFGVSLLFIQLTFTECKLPYNVFVIGLLTSHKSCILPDK